MAREGGFALIEVLIAIVITLLIIVPLYDTFSMGFQAWNRQNQELDVEGDLRLVIELLHKDISSAFHPQFRSGQAFHGERRSIDFLTKKSKEGIYRVRYTFSEYDGSLDYSISFMGKKIEDIRLCEDLIDASFSYYDDISKIWLYSWDNGYLPKAVRVRLKFRDSRELEFTIPLESQSISKSEGFYDGR